MSPELNREVAETALVASGSGGGGAARCDRTTRGSGGSSLDDAMFVICLAVASAAGVMAPLPDGELAKTGLAAEP